MSIIQVSDTGDEYYTPKYVVEIIANKIDKDTVKTIWCPFDKEWSEYVIVLKEMGFNVINTHIDNGEDFLMFEPKFEFDAIVSNPPFSIKNEVFEKTISYKKPWSLLMSATSIQSSSFVKILSKEENFNFIMFDKRISYNGDRPPFPSWYFTGRMLDKNYFYIYEKDPKDMYEEWEGKAKHVFEKNKGKETEQQLSLF